MLRFIGMSPRPMRARGIVQVCKCQVAHGLGYAVGSAVGSAVGLTYGLGGVYITDITIQK